MKATVKITFSTSSISEGDPSEFSEQLVEALQNLDPIFINGDEPEDEDEEQEEIEFTVTEVEVLTVDG